MPATDALLSQIQFWVHSQGYRDDNVVAVCVQLDQLEITVTDVAVQEVIIALQHSQLGQLIHDNGYQERASDHDEGLSPFTLGFGHPLNQPVENLGHLIVDCVVDIFHTNAVAGHTAAAFALTVCQPAFLHQLFCCWSVCSNLGMASSGISLVQKNRSISSNLNQSAFSISISTSSKLSDFLPFTFSTNICAAWF